MMVQPVVSRSQRRLEKKQLVLIIVLVFAVAGVSFSLGVMFGQRSTESAELSSKTEASTPPIVTKIAAPPPPKPVAAPEPPEKLTFYDNLPNGNQAPLGSGINLPPEQPKKAVVKSQSTVVAIPKVKTAAVAKQVIAPVASASGIFVVQIASFRTGEDARKLATRLENYRLTTFVESADLGEKGVWHRVLAGPYADRENADQVAGLLKEKERLSALVRKR